MSTQVQIRRGTTAEHSTFTGAVGELTVDTTKDTAVVHDGATAGGRPLLREDQSNLPSTAPANGIYLSGANTLAVATNSTKRLEISSDGRIGVGASPTIVSTALLYDSDAPLLQFVNDTTGTTDADGSLLYQAGNDFYIDNAEAGSVVISTNGTQRLLIEADGDINIDSGGVFYDATNNRLAIGVTSPSRALTVSGVIQSEASNTAGGLFYGAYTGTTSGNQLGSLNFFGTGAGVTGETAIRGILDGGSTTSAHLTFSNTNAGVLSERARIDSSGRLLVGTSSVQTIDGIQTSIQLQGTTGATSSISAIRHSDDAGGGFIELGKSRATATGGVTVVSNNDTLGTIVFCGADGTDLDSRAAIIRCEVDGTPGANDMPGRLVFSTTADGASSPTERMRIAQNGSIDIGGAFSSGTRTKRLTPDVIQSSWDSTNSRTHQEFINPNGVVGSISTSGSATSFSTSSDYRLKENIVPLIGAADRVNQLQVHRFNFIADPDKTVDGFIAHEAQAVVPECVTGTKDEVDADGNPVYQGIDQSKLVPLLTAALQEAIGEIESLKARVAALESA